MAFSVLAQLGQRVLDQAERDENFGREKFEYHTVEIFAVGWQAPLTWL